MTGNITSARGGEFATARRPRAAEHIEFIRERRRAGVPVSAIARMIGCNPVEVGRIAELDSGVERVCGTPDPAPHVLPNIRMRNGRPVRRRREDEWSEARERRKREMPKRARVIVEKIASEHGFSVEDLIGYRLFKGVSRARNHAIHDLYLTGLYSTPILGGYFGGRDHTSILNALRNHREAMASDVDAWRALGSEAA